MKTINDLVQEYQERQLAHGLGMALGSPILYKDYVVGVDDNNLKSKLFFAIKVAFAPSRNNRPATHCESSLVAA